MSPAPEVAFEQSDIGNCRRLIARHGEDFRYVSGRFWIYDGRRWTVDECRRVEHWAKLTVRDILVEAAGIEQDDKRATLAKWAIASQAVQRIKAMVELTKSDPSIAAVQAIFDAPAASMLCNVLNGTLDLTTQTLREHRREDHITKLAPVAYDPDAPCDVWNAFLHQTFAGNTQVIAFVKRWIGYMLTADTREQKLLFCQGAGSNGKGVIFRTLRGLCGDYYAQIDFATLLENKRNGSSPSPDIARLVGARIAVASESNGSHRLNEGLLKSLTGQDPMTARHLNCPPFEFMPDFKLCMISNERPTIRGTDHGIWRRMLLLLFGVIVPDERVDHTLERTLQGPELPGIFRWAVEGCAEWLERGLAIPDEIRGATQEYRAEQDVFATFLEEHCELDASATERASAILFRLNATLPRAEQFNARRLADALKRHDFKQVRNKHGVRWIGLRLSTEGVGSVGSVAESDKDSFTRVRESDPKNVVEATPATPMLFQDAAA